MASDPIQFGGEEQFDAPAERVFTLLTDLDGLPRMIPDLVSAERVDDRSLRCVVRPGFSFLRGTLKVAISLDEMQPPTSASMTVAAQGIGVSMRIASHLEIEREGADRSKLSWRATLAEVKGLAAALSPSLLKAAADQVIRHAWGKVRNELAK